MKTLSVKRNKSTSTVEVKLLHDGEMYVATFYPLSDDGVPPYRASVRTDPVEGNTFKLHDGTVDDVQEVVDIIQTWADSVDEQEGGRITKEMLKHIKKLKN